MEEKLLLSAERVDALLAELCIKLGYCLHPVANVRITNSPPRTIDRFTDVVISADGEDPRFCPVRDQVHKVVERHFEAAANSEV